MSHLDNKLRKESKYFPQLSKSNTENIQAGGLLWRYILRGDVLEKPSDNMLKVSLRSLKPMKRHIVSTRCEETLRKKIYSAIIFNSSLKKKKKKAFLHHQTLFLLLQLLQTAHCWLTEVDSNVIMCFPASPLSRSNLCR